MQVPDSACFRQYLAWWNATAGVNCGMGIVVTAAGRFVELHGAANYKRTMFSLALNGYPAPLVCTVFGEEAGERIFVDS